jgi:glycosyltransferase involved in cell wall biosynthesis
MRLLFLNHTGTVSGAERALLDLVAALSGRHEVVVACPRPGELAGAVRGLGIRWHPLPAFEASFRPHPIQTPAGLAALAAGSLAVQRLATRIAPDAVYANTTRAALMSVLVRRRRGLPLAVRLHDHLPGSRAGQTVRNAIAGSADTVLAVSEFTAAHFNAGLRRGRARCVHNGIDLARFDPVAVAPAPLRTEHGLDPGSILLGHVAQITPWKAQADSIAITARLRADGLDAHLFLVGGIAFAGRPVRYDNPAYLDHLHRLAGQLGVSGAVHFLGSRRDVPALLGAFDLSLLPSREEPGALAVVESLAMGTPAFVSARGGTAEFVRDGRSGATLPAGDIDAWAQAIRGLVLDGTALARMGRHAREDAARFTLEASVEATMAEMARMVALAPRRQHG